MNVCPLSLIAYKALHTEKAQILHKILRYIRNLATHNSCHSLHTVCHKKQDRYQWTFMCCFFSHCHYPSLTSHFLHDNQVYQSLTFISALCSTRVGFLKAKPSLVTAPLLKKNLSGDPYIKDKSRSLF